MAERKHDWEIIGSRDPYFGVLVAPEFKADVIDEASRARFYVYGEGDIAHVMAMFDAEFAARPSEGVALDIGCGVGRLTYAMAKIAPQVIGYDVSESMVEEARKRAPANARFTTKLPDESFSWISSYLVFQHIPPEEGLKLLGACLDRLAPGGFVSIHLTAWSKTKPSNSLLARFRRWRNLRIHRQAGRSVHPLIRMHDYNFSDVMQCFMSRGISRIALRHVEHGDHHGAWVLARR